MAEPSPALKLNPERLRRLLQLSREKEDGEDPDPDHQKLLLLWDYLSDTLPLEAKTRRVLPSLLQQVCGDASRFEGPCIYELFQESGTALHQLGAAKTLAKAKVGKAVNPEEKEAAGVVYYAAIAAGLVYHGKKITRLSSKQLRDSFDSLATREWLPTDLRDLFKVAAMSTGA